MQTSNATVLTNTANDSAYSYSGEPILNYIAIGCSIVLLVVIVVNLVLGVSLFLQIMDYIQLIALSLYLEIQYPPILENMLRNIGIVLFSFFPSLDKLPYKFSTSKFIIYHNDSSILRQIPIVLVFILILLAFVGFIIFYEIKQHFKQV